MSKIEKTEEGWKKVLTPEQYRTLRKKDTERPGTGKYYKHEESGVYCCAGCNTPLYKSGSKFDAKSGWPAFFDAMPGAVTRQKQRSFWGVETEVVCTACGGHLGHLFKGEGFRTPTNERHCINSVSLKFKDGVEALEIESKSASSQAQ